MRVYYDADADLNLIKGKKVAVIGYGSQGFGHSNNLKESGVAEVAVALKETLRHPQEGGGARACADMTPSEAARWADVVMVLVPDELQADLYKDELAANLKDGAALMFAHGFNIHFRLIEPRPDLDVLMVAPKGPGHLVRSEYVKGGGVPCLVAIHQDASRAVPSTSASPTPAPSAAAGPASSRPASRRNARPTCSASRPSSAAASAP